MNRESDLIFVCGARRTGTTLLAAMLAADPTTPPLPGEAQLLTEWVRSYAWAKDYPEIRSVPFFENVEQLRDYYRAMLGTFIDHCYRHFTGVRVLVLKSPELSLCFGAARELFPQAKFVVSVRDPRDQIASEWRVFERRRGGPQDERLLRDRDFASLARSYLRYYEPIVKALDEQSARVHLQSFEQMVSQPRQAIESLQRFTGLDLSGFDPERPWPRVADSYWAYGSSPSDTPHYGQPVAMDRVGAWRESMTEDEAQTVVRLCGDMDRRLRQLSAARTVGEEA